MLLQSGDCDAYGEVWVTRGSYRTSTPRRTSGWFDQRICVSYMYRPTAFNSRGNLCRALRHKHSQLRQERQYGGKCTLNCVLMMLCSHWCAGCCVSFLAVKHMHVILSNVAGWRKSESHLSTITCECRWLQSCRILVLLYVRWNLHMWHLLETTFTKHTKVTYIQNTVATDILCISLPVNLWHFWTVSRFNLRKFGLDKSIKWLFLVTFGLFRPFSTVSFSKSVLCCFLTNIRPIEFQYLLWQIPKSIMHWRHCVMAHHVFWAPKWKTSLKVGASIVIPYQV